MAAGDAPGQMRGVGRRDFTKVLEGAGKSSKVP
jgi:hypothetical protein